MCPNYMHSIIMLLLGLKLYCLASAQAPTQSASTYKAISTIHVQYWSDVTCSMQSEWYAINLVTLTVICHSIANMPSQASD